MMSDSKDALKEISDPAVKREMRQIVTIYGGNRSARFLQ